MPSTNPGSDDIDGEDHQTAWHALDALPDTLSEKSKMYWRFCRRMLEHDEAGEDALARKAAEELMMHADIPLFVRSQVHQVLAYRALSDRIEHAQLAIRILERVQTDTEVQTQAKSRLLIRAHEALKFAERTTQAWEEAKKAQRAKKAQAKVQKSKNNEKVVGGDSTGIGSKEIEINPASKKGDIAPERSLELETPSLDPVSTPATSTVASKKAANYGSPSKADRRPDLVAKEKVEVERKQSEDSKKY